MESTGTLYYVVGWTDQSYGIQVNKKYMGVRSYTQKTNTIKLT